MPDTAQLPTLKYLILHDHWWNEVNRAKTAANERQKCNISLETLEEYFRNKFDVKEDQNSELVTKYEQTVGEKYEQVQHRENQNSIFCS